MKRIILISGMFFTSLTLKAQDSFNGEWSYRFYNNRYSFSITLKEDSGKITGSHIAFIDSMQIIDERNNSINGKVENGVASITIKSGRTAKIPGVAKIVHIGKDSIKFTLIKVPTGGEHLMLKEAILVKQQPNQ